MEAVLVGNESCRLYEVVAGLLFMCHFFWCDACGTRHSRPGAAECDDTAFEGRWSVARSWSLLRSSAVSVSPRRLAADGHVLFVGVPFFRLEVWVQEVCCVEVGAGSMLASAIEVTMK